MFRTLFVVLLACAPAWADVPLKPSHHVPNGVPTDDGGYCQWASWETLGNCLHIQALKGLKLRRSHEDIGGSSRFIQTGGWHWEGGQAVYNGYWKRDKTSPGPAHVHTVVSYLEKLGVKAHACYGTPNVEFLQQLCDGGVGAVTRVIDLPGLPGRPVLQGGHVVYVIGCTRDQRVCINPYTLQRSQPERLVTYYDCNHPGRTFTVEYSWFARYWDGTASHLARPKPPPKVRKKR